MAFVLALLGGLAAPARTQSFTVLHDFSGANDGGSPSGVLTIDRGGSLYGTANGGGAHFDGTVFMLKHSGSNWLFNLLYSFDGAGGANPSAAVVFGPNGTLYGTTTGGGNPACLFGCGTVYKLQPQTVACKTALCPWTHTLLYQFSGGADGGEPGYGDVIFDAAGNMYGTTLGGGAFTEGVVYELTPSGSGWTESVLWSFGQPGDGREPFSGVIFDRSGNLFGTTFEGGAGNTGTVFELMPTMSGWTDSILSNGGYPIAGLT
jgi:uncharacterized repeat protein (TIGR03803 family)